MSNNTVTSTFETWVAWVDGGEAVGFQVPVEGTYDVAEAGAAALGIDVCKALNVERRIHQK